MVGDNLQEEENQDEGIEEEFKKMEIKENGVEEQEDGYCIQSSMARSTYYQTNHSTSVGLATTQRPWMSPQAHPRKRVSFIYRSSVHKNGEVIKLLNGEHLSPRCKIIRKTSEFQSSPDKSSFRTRMIKPSPSLLDLRPCISASGYIAMWSDTLDTPMAHNVDEVRQMASLTKIMTAITVMGLCKEYNVKVREQWIPIHTCASYMEGTSANLRSGEEILLLDLLFGLMLPSGNDAGTALAQFFGKFLSFKFTKEESNQRYSPSMEEFNQIKSFYDQEYQRQSIRLFVFQMNRYAHKLGLKSTHFDNPTGLSNKDNYSTPKDLAILTAACLKQHLLRQVVRRKAYKCEVRNDKLGYNRQVLWHNTNKHLYKIRGCMGVKTGITPAAGPCLSSAYRIFNRELIVIVLGCQDKEIRYQDAQNIYRWCRRQQIPK